MSSTFNTSRQFLFIRTTPNSVVCNLSKWFYSSNPDSSFLCSERIIGHSQAPPHNCSTVSALKCNPSCITSFMESLLMREIFKEWMRCLAYLDFRVADAPAIKISLFIPINHLTVFQTGGYFCVLLLSLPIEYPIPKQVKSKLNTAISPKISIGSALLSQIPFQVSM